ncbi:hypothetical protein NMY22_g15762 [Coprinellus aureogranulatus]|nr:hypothetical protein NMY22_g15762 [Coprinellus aureogranulatus]
MKAPKLAEQRQAQHPATAPPAPVRARRGTELVVSLHFKKPVIDYGDVYAELYDDLVEARKVKRRVQQRVKDAEHRVRAGVRGAQESLALAMEELEDAEEARVEAERALNEHRKTLPGGCR